MEININECSVSKNPRGGPLDYVAVHTRDQENAKKGYFLPIMARDAFRVSKGQNQKKGYVCGVNKYAFRVINSK